MTEKQAGRGGATLLASNQPNDQMELPMSSTPKTFDLNSNTAIPAVGFGTYLISNDDAEMAISAAIMAGYRHIDTASGYQKRRNGWRRDQKGAAKRWNFPRGPVCDCQTLARKSRMG